MAKRLSTEQRIAIGFLSQPKNGGLTYEQIANECGVARSTIYEWLKDDTFDRELRKEQKRVVTKYVPDVVKAMADNAIAEGNAAAAKLILQMAEQLTEKHEVTTDRKEAPDIDELKRLVSEIDGE